MQETRSFSDLKAEVIKKGSTGFQNYFRFDCGVRRLSSILPFIYSAKLPAQSFEYSFTTMASKPVPRIPLKSLCDEDQKSNHTPKESQVQLKRSCECDVPASKVRKSNTSSTGNDVGSERSLGDCETQPFPKPNLVSKDSKELLMLPYTDSILEFVGSLEAKHSVKADYLEQSKRRITAENRAILVDWLTEVTGFHNDQPETLYTAVKLLDVFLSKYPVSKSRLQLAGLAIYWIATKLEEYETLTASECVDLMQYGSSNSLLRMERLVLQTLKFETLVTEPFFYLRRALCYVENGDNKQFIDTCTYCLDSSLVDITTVGETANDLASAALYAARLIFGLFKWTESLGYITGHWPKPDKLRPLAHLMLKSALRGLDKSSPYRGAYKKYSRKTRSHRLSEERIKYLLRVLEAP